MVFGVLVCRSMNRHEAAHLIRAQSLYPFAVVAQLVEQQFCKLPVQGSNPCCGSTLGEFATA